MGADSTDEKVMLITGAARRIGAAIAHHAHDCGYRVVVHYRTSEQEASELTDTLNDKRPGTAITVQGDFEDASVYENLIAACIDQWGRLDVLVNNASEFFPTPLGSIEIGDIAKTFRANVYAPLLLSQAAMPQLASCKGSVINIVDIYASTVHPDHPVYCASKAALSMLTKSLAFESAPDVRVNGIAPGAILWPEGDCEQTKAAKLDLIPLKKIGTAEQIAAAVVYLSSDEASFITGQILALDGGRTL